MTDVLARTSSSGMTVIVRNQVGGHGYRLFVIDCPHGHAEVNLDVHPRDNNIVLSRLIADLKQKVAADPDTEDCDCTTPMLS